MKRKQLVGIIALVITLATVVKLGGDAIADPSYDGDISVEVPKEEKATDAVEIVAPGFGGPKEVEQGKPYKLFTGISAVDTDGTDITNRLVCTVDGKDIPYKADALLDTKVAGKKTLTYKVTSAINADLTTTLEFPLTITGFTELPDGKPNPGGGDEVPTPPPTEETKGPELTATKKLVFVTTGTTQKKLDEQLAGLFKATDKNGKDISSTIDFGTKDVDTIHPGVRYLVASVTEGDKTTTLDYEVVVNHDIEAPFVEMIKSSIEVKQSEAASVDLGSYVKRIIDAKDGEIKDFKVMLFGKEITTLPNTANKYPVEIVALDSDGKEGKGKLEVVITKSNTKPELELKQDSVTVSTDDTLDLRSYIAKAFDAEDGDCTNSVKLFKDGKQIYFAMFDIGEHNIVYQLEDSDGNKIEKSLKITVTKGKDEEPEKPNPKPDVEKPEDVKPEEPKPPTTGGQETETPKPNTEKPKPAIDGKVPKTGDGTMLPYAISAVGALGLLGFIKKKKK